MQVLLRGIFRDFFVRKTLIFTITPTKDSLLYHFPFDLSIFTSELLKFLSFAQFDILFKGLKM